MGKKVWRWRGKLADEESNVPRAGALSETMALPRLWRGGDDRLRRRFLLPVEFVLLLEIRGSYFYRFAFRAGRAHARHSGDKWAE